MSSRLPGSSCSREQSSRTSRSSPRGPAGTEQFPDDLDPRVASALVAQGITGLYTHQAETWEALRARRQRDRDDEYREREEPRLQPARSRPARPRAEEPGAVPLSDEGARTGPGARARRVRRQGHQAGDLRRGHRDGAPLADPQVGERRPDEPGHAPRGRPPASRPLGRRAREPPLRGRRRGARLPRRVRVARRATCSGGSAGSRARTTRSRSSSWHRRRSRTHHSWPSRSSASRRR